MTPSYDADGHPLADGFHTYTWDSEGRVGFINTTAFPYAALNRNVEQNRGGTYYQFLYAPTGQKLAIMKGQTLS